ncbi:MAG TPA: HPF/RaiA family ribosome-associated protein [Bryobacteraceae bacterium]|jgi:ribosome-associated translation inhibitor RaiA|nr:HPF/RaiA family ribosome-associated protein [Bryobacteraceae bacterium]
MQIQINSDKNIAVDEAISTFITDELTRALTHFESRLTRVEVHLSDANADKSGPRDKRCLIEVRPRNHQPVTTSDEGSNVEQTVKGAANKMKNALQTLFDRQSNPRK